jgi:pilus assembly protein CpaC
LWSSTSRLSRRGRQSDVADIVVINPTQLYVLAKDIGTTNVLFWSRDNRLIGSINLEVVRPDGLKSKL